MRPWGPTLNCKVVMWVATWIAMAIAKVPSSFGDSVVCELVIRVTFDNCASMTAGSAARCALVPDR